MNIDILPVLIKAVTSLKTGPDNKSLPRPYHRRSVYKVRSNLLSGSCDIILLRLLDSVNGQQRAEQMVSVIAVE